MVRLGRILAILLAIPPRTQEARNSSGAFRLDSRLADLSRRSRSCRVMEYLLLASVAKFRMTRLKRRRGDELEALSRGPLRPRGGGGRRHIRDSSCLREFAIHSTGGNPRAPGDEEKKSGLQRRSPGEEETQGLGNRGSPPGPNSMVKTPESPLYVGTTMREQEPRRTKPGGREQTCA